MAQHNEIGKKGEIIAADYLEKQGYDILATNWRYRREEIDIVAQNENTLVIAEVKSRTSTLHQHPKESVSRVKQNHLISAANAYIEEFGIERECRFDVVSIVFDLKYQRHEIEHIKDAFGLST